MNVSSLQDAFSTRVRAVTKVLGSEDPVGNALPLQFALSNHLIEGAARALKEHSEDAVDWYRTTSIDSLIAELSTDGRRIVLNPSRSEYITSEISDTSYYLVAPGSQPAPIDRQEIVTAAVSLAGTTSYAWLVSEFAPIVCLLSRKSPADTLHSWSISRLVGTVFLDFTDSPEILARDLVHEAGHNYLNLRLSTRAIELGDESYFSPWRASMRPAFGFLHACWSFPLTVIVSNALIDLSPPDIRQFLKRYVESQAPLIEMAKADFYRAVAVISDLELRQQLVDVFTEANAISSAPK